MTKPKLKTCSKCKVVKPLSAFYKDSGSPDGKCYWCKDCTTQRQKELEEKKMTKQTGETSSKQVSKSENLILKIDFTHYQELYEKLMNQAKKDYRSPDMQVLYWIGQKNIIEEV